MSYPAQHGSRMDQPSGIAGSVKMARERAAAAAASGASSSAGAGASTSTLSGGGMDTDFYQASEESIADDDYGNYDNYNYNDDNRTQRQPPPVAAPPPSKIPRPQGQASSTAKTSRQGVPISRPTQIPQWPLRGPPPSSSANPGSSNYRPPAGKSQPPQRPPRPSRVPSLLDASRIQEPVPTVFPFQQQQQPQEPTQQRESNDLLSVPQGPSSRPSTVSSVGTIPDFPVPDNQQMGQRRSVNLGPPPSARRGASSFYSHASFVSPIPEESPRSRSHGSYASSHAMPPEGWTQDSPRFRVNDPESFFDERVRESSMYSDDEFGDESQLVRSASVGKRGVAALVTTPVAQSHSQAAEAQMRGSIHRPAPSPLQPDIFSTGTGFLDASSSSSNALPTTKNTKAARGLGMEEEQPSRVTPDSMLDAFGSSDPVTGAQERSLSPRGFSRFSAIRRPPQLDMEAVRDAESRGSLTSLPDLIRRATRLAAMIDKGRRPASRFDIDDYPEDMYGQWDPEKDPSINDKHQSGLSDMLAAFPPPAHTANRRSLRQSFRQSAGTAWPLPFGRPLAPQDNNVGGEFGDDLGGNGNGNGVRAVKPELGEIPQRPADNRRRCCGLPLWGFIVVIVIVLILIAAAVIIPLQFFVLQRGNSSAQPALAECQAELNCANGGTNVISQGICSCICTNGFTGSSCTIAGSTGCAAATITSPDSTNISNVTLGQAIPRLIETAQANFSIPLSATTILAKLNTGNLSCAAQNALVTFSGRSSRSTDVTAEAAVDDEQFVTITLQPGGSSTVTLSVAQATGMMTFSTLIQAPSITTIFATTITLGNPRTTPTPSPSTPSTRPPSSFRVSDDVLDFARVAVLFILQQQTLQDASEAQRVLQRLFSEAQEDGIAPTEALNVNIGNDNQIDLVNFVLDIGNGPVGGGRS